MFLTRRSVLVTFLGLLLGSCSDDPLAPFEPEVNNATDSFQLQATGLQNVNTTLTYTWRNTGTLANVNHSSTTTAGEARLVIRTTSGALVYDKQLQPSLNEPTTVGASGDWRIELILSNYTGTLNFRVQKP